MAKKTPKKQATNVAAQSDVVKVSELEPKNSRAYVVTGAGSPPRVFEGRNARPDAEAEAKRRAGPKGLVKYVPLK